MHLEITKLSSSLFQTLQIEGRLRLGSPSGVTEVCCDFQVNKTKVTISAMQPPPHGSIWMKRVVICCSLQPTLPHGAPPAPEWLCCPVVQHYSEPNTEHLIWHWSLDGSSTCTTNLSIKMSSDWPLWEPLSNAVIYKYIKHTYHCATSFYQWAHWFLISS